MSELISFFREMLETSRERIKTPITGAFIFSFIAYNWKPIVIFIYSKQSIENTVELISSEYCSYWTILAPLIISIIYTTILPYGIMHIEKFHTAAKKKRKDIFNDVKEHELKKKAIILKLEKDNEDVRSGNVEKSFLNDKILSLEKQVEISSKHNSILNDKIIKLESDNVDLNSRNEFKSAEYEKLSKENNRLSTQNKRLSIENNDLSMTSAQLSIDNEALSIENERLSVENEQMIIDIENSIDEDTYLYRTEIHDDISGERFIDLFSTDDDIYFNQLNKDIKPSDKKQLKSIARSTQPKHNSIRFTTDLRSKLEEYDLINYLDSSKDEFKFNLRGLYFLKEILN
ncbi:hypothetical protein [Flavobacterium sp. WV_118_3]|uniref:hypothetical protein n=1 Tax=Flavobacterium sp. WV_118_3 TaxID=3151764 RepID=UPI003219DDD0